MLHQVGSRVEARKCAEVVNKMRLVEITAGQRDIHPLDLLLPSDQVQRLLKTLDAAKQLWCHTYFFTEYLDKSPLAEAKLLRQIRDRSYICIWRYTLELF